MPIGTYVSITQLVVLADGSRWLNCTYDSITGYIEEQNINVFPNEEWCGGANYRDLSKHSLNIKIMAYLNAVNVDIMLTKRHIITI